MEEITEDRPKRKQVAPAMAGKKAAKLYVENIQHNLGKTQKEVFLEAGYSEATNPSLAKRSKFFVEELDRLMPREKIVRRINVGLDNENDSIALGYCKLGADIQGLTSGKAVGASGNQINIKTDNVNLANILNWSPPGLVEDED